MACNAEQNRYDQAVSNVQDAKRETATALHDLADATENYVVAGSLGPFVSLVGALVGVKELATATTKTTATGVQWAWSFHEADARVDRANAAYTKAKNHEIAQWNTFGHALVALLSCRNHQPDEGCGSRGGPGWRTHRGKCASWTDHQ